jgi:hypothetical protein
MSSKGNRGSAQIAWPDRQFSKSLYGVGVKADAVFAAYCGEFLDRLDCPRLVVRVHDGDKNRIRTQSGLEISGIETPCVVNGKDREVEAFVVFKMLERAENRVVLRSRRDDVPSARSMSPGDAQNG